MRCCKQTQTDSKEAGQNQAKHGGGKHMLLMMLCCLVPTGGVLALTAIGYESTANYLMLLLCPLMHLFMMRGMTGGKRQSASIDNDAEK